MTFSSAQVHCIKLRNGSVADRDLVGAHNILVKYLTEYYALGDTPAI